MLNLGRYKIDFLVHSRIPSQHKGIQHMFGMDAKELVPLRFADRHSGQNLFYFDARHTFYPKGGGVEGVERRFHLSVRGKPPRGQGWLLLVSFPYRTLIPLQWGWLRRPSGGRPLFCALRGSPGWWRWRWRCSVVVFAVMFLQCDRPTPPTVDAESVETGDGGVSHERQAMLSRRWAIRYRATSARR